MKQKLAFGTKLWIGLVAYIFGVDFYALLTDKEPLTEAFRRALENPKRRWIVTVSWILTTKHLFFGHVIPWLDPFGLIALGVGVIKKYLKKEKLDVSISSIGAGRTVPKYGFWRFPAHLSWPGHKAGS